MGELSNVLGCYEQFARRDKNERAKWTTDCPSNLWQITKLEVSLNQIRRHIDGLYLDQSLPDQGPIDDGREEILVAFTRPSSGGRVPDS